MLSSLPPLNALRGFEAAARLGSFKAAAEELNLTPSAVSHQIAKLEDHLALPLFLRDGRQLRLTDMGETYRHRVHEALTLLAQATQDARRGGGAPTLSIVAAPSFAGKWLMPRLDEFIQAHPDLRVRVEATAARRSLGDADVGIFYGLPEDSGVATVPLVAERVLPMCAPALIAGTRALRSPADLTHHVLIHARNRLQWPSWLAANGNAELPIRREMWADRSSMAIEAAVKGLGVILESDFLAADELRRGELVPAFGTFEDAPLEHAYFLVTRSTNTNQDTVADFTAWVRGEVAAGG